MTAGKTIKVNFVSKDPILIEKLKPYKERRTELDIIFSEQPVAGEGKPDIFVLPVEMLLEHQVDLLYGQRGISVIAYGPGRYLRKAFLSGCMDYLKSPWDSEELECRVDRIIEKQRKLFSFPWGDFTLREGHLHCTTAKLGLSVQERIILKKLILNRNQPVSRDVLYYAMWGKPYAKKSRVVDMHISALRRKLYSNLPHSKGCITSIKGLGYMISWTNQEK